MEIEKIIRELKSDTIRWALSTRHEHTLYSCLVTFSSYVPGMSVVPGEVRHCDIVITPLGHIKYMVRINGIICSFNSNDFSKYLISQSIIEEYRDFMINKILQ